MSVPFLDLGRLHASIRPELDAAFASTLASSGFVGGTTVRDFEVSFAAAHGAAAAAGCASGTDALALALRALGIGLGHEVIVPSMTFVATAEAVLHVGASPVIADVDPRTLLLSPATVEAVASERTAAVVPVHLYGHLVPFDHLAAWRARGWVVVEDAAQAHLGTWRGRPVGTAGHAACFSFFPGKNLGALGDGGLVLSNDQALVDRVRSLRDHGRRDKYVHDEPGWCSRLDALQAAFLAVKLRHLPAWTDGRRRVAARYADLLGELVVPWEDGAVHHLLVIEADDRERLRSRLAAAGVGSGVHYPVPLSLQPALEPWRRSTPAAERAAGRIVSLPLDPLMVDDDVDEVAAAVHSSMRVPG